jgi:2'-5' RNA ligase
VPVIGVALSIPEPWAGQLQDYRSRIDPSAALIPTHITLVPPTVLADDDVAEVEDHLTKVAEGASTFRVHLRGTGTFRPVSPVVFISVVEGISGTEQLAAALRSGPLDIEVHFPYHPHVTVAHDLSDEQLDRAFDDLSGFECSFEVADFHLYVHDETEGWRPTRDFALRPAEPPPATG